MIKSITKKKKTAIKTNLKNSFTKTVFAFPQSKTVFKKSLIMLSSLFTEC